MPLTSFLMFLWAPVCWLSTCSKLLELVVYLPLLCPEPIFNWCLIFESMNGWMDVWVDEGWMDGCIDGWVDV